MRVLLNATGNELRQLGGDFTLYQDWRRLEGADLKFDLIAADGLRSGNVLLRKGLEKLCRPWQPVSLRRRLLLGSRFLYIPQRALNGVDLIFSHLLFPWIPQTRIPVVWSSQGISPAVYYECYNGGQWTVDDVAFIYHVLGQQAHALVIATDRCARNVMEWCPELIGKVHVVPAPVFANANTCPEKPSKQDGLMRMLFVGVDAIRKGLPEVLEAFRVLKEKHANLRLDIVSRPSEELKRKGAALEGASLHLSSPDVDVRSLMARADVFVLPTRADTYALAAVEAMAYGCAIVLSDLEPLPEVAPENEVGFLVPPGDVGALVDRLETLLTSEERLRRFQEGAWQRYLSRHAPTVVAKRLREIFDTLVR